MSNPKIKVDADLSSFQSELSKLQQTIVQLGNQLKTESGKSNFNFKGSKKELDALINSADKLTGALDKGDKKSAQYVKNLQAAQKAMADAAKVSAKLEGIGDARNNKVSGYFGATAGELADEHAAFARLAAEEKKRDRETEKHKSRNEKWIGAAGKLAGFVSGAMMGGGGGYSVAGSYFGSRLGGAVGGQVGGLAGGLADRYIGGAKEEAKAYSELRRSIGSVTTDFTRLRDSVRSVVNHMGIADTEAAKLAKQFAGTAGINGNPNDIIGRTIGTATGFAQGYGIDAAQSVDFFAKMKLSGVSGNDKDNRRLAMMIGESVQRGGTSAKMDEVLSAVSNFSMQYAQTNLVAGNAGQFASYLASLTGSSYAGLKGNPNGAAALLNEGNAGVMAGGRGEASQFHWMRARQSAFPGSNWMDNEAMQNTGLIGDLSSQYGPQSPEYQKALADGDQKALSRMDRTRSSINDSGYSNNFQVVRDYIKKISGGDSQVESRNFAAMAGISNSSKAAALWTQLSSDQGLGDLQSKLSGFGVNPDKANPSQIAAMSQLVYGGPNAMNDQFSKLVGTGKMTSDELNNLTGAKAAGGDEFKRLLLKMTEQYDTDDGLNSQVSTIDIANKTERAVSALVPIETDVRDYMLKLLDHFGEAGPAMARIAEIAKASAPMGGKTMSGGDYNATPAKAREHVMADINDSLSAISTASTMEEKQKLYDKAKSKATRNQDGYPAETMKWLDNAMGKTADPVVQPLGEDNSVPTVSGTVAPAWSGKGLSTPNKHQRSLVAGVLGNDKFDSLYQKIGAEVGVDPLMLELFAQKESGQNPNATNSNTNGTTDLGIMQHNSRYAGARGVNSRNWADPETNIRAGAKFIKLLLDKNDGNIEQMASNYNGSGPAAAAYGRDFAETYRVLSDQMPAGNKSAPKSNTDSIMFRHEIGVTLQDLAGNKIAPPTVSTVFGAPVAAGR